MGTEFGEKMRDGIVGSLLGERRTVPNQQTPAPKEPALSEVEGGGGMR